MQVPSNMLISSKKVRPSLYMCCCMMGWAVVSACTALAKDYKGLVLVRFFLGIAEAPYYPGALYLLSLFYTRKEIATRLSILYSGNILATSFSGLIAAATFATLDGAHGLTGWVSPIDPLSRILAVAKEACVALVVHYRRDCHFRRCDHRYFPASGLPAHHPVAETRGEAIGP